MAASTFTHGVSHLCSTNTSSCVLSSSNNLSCVHWALLWWIIKRIWVQWWNQLCTFYFRLKKCRRGLPIRHELRVDFLTVLGHGVSKAAPDTRNQFVLFLVQGKPSLSSCFSPSQVPNLLEQKRNSSCLDLGNITATFSLPQEPRHSSV